MVIVSLRKIHVLTYGLQVQNILNDFQYFKPDNINFCNLLLVFFGCSRGVLKATMDGSAFFYFSQQFLFLLFDSVKYLGQNGLAMINGSLHIF